MQEFTYVGVEETEFMNCILQLAPMDCPSCSLEIPESLECFCLNNGLLVRPLLRQNIEFNICQRIHINLIKFIFLITCFCGLWWLLMFHT